MLGRLEAAFVFLENRMKRFRTPSLLSCRFSVFAGPADRVAATGPLQVGRVAGSVGTTTEAAAF